MHYECQTQGTITVFRQLIYLKSCRNKHISSCTSFQLNFCNLFNFYFSPDTFRVISQHAEDTHLKHEFEEVNEPSEWRKVWLKNEGLALPDIYNRKTEVLPKAVPDYRMNRPHPGSCGFLRNNVRLLNEPICSVYTDLPKNEQQHWWPSRISNEPLQVPPRTNDTVYREDFLNKERPTSGFGSLRHTANPNKEPALGTGIIL